MTKRWKMLCLALLASLTWSSPALADLAYMRKPYPYGNPLLAEPGTEAVNGALAGGVMVLIALLPAIGAWLLANVRSGRMPKWRGVLDFALFLVGNEFLDAMKKLLNKCRAPEHDASQQVIGYHPLSAWETSSPTLGQMPAVLFWTPTENHLLGVKPRILRCPAGRHPEYCPGTGASRASPSIIRLRPRPPRAVVPGMRPPRHSDLSPIPCSAWDLPSPRAHQEAGRANPKEAPPRLGERRCP